MWCPKKQELSRVSLATTVKLLRQLEIWNILTYRKYKLSRIFWFSCRSGYKGKTAYILLSLSYWSKSIGEGWAGAFGNVVDKKHVAHSFLLHKTDWPTPKWWLKITWPTPLIKHKNLAYISKWKQHFCMKLSVRLHSQIQKHVETLLAYIQRCVN